MFNTTLNLFGIAARSENLIVQVVEAWGRFYFWDPTQRIKSCNKLALHLCLDYKYGEFRLAYLKRLAEFSAQTNLQMRMSFEHDCVTFLDKYDPKKNEFKDCTRPRCFSVPYKKKEFKTLERNKKAGTK